MAKLGLYWFQTIAKAGRAAGMSSDTRTATKASRKWFRERAKEVRAVNVNQTIAESPENRQKTRLTQDDLGRMFHFFYDAKHKATLPYWDQFPLVFPIDIQRGSMLGLNMHYLPVAMRARLMDALYTVAERNAHNTVQRVKLSYNVLKTAARFAYFRPCIKRYLFPHVKSRFMRVNSSEWDMALFLPTARFVGATETKVWRDSAKIIKKHGARP